jgi:hypothetical protein
VGDPGENISIISGRKTMSGNRVRSRWLLVVAFLIAFATGAQAVTSLTVNGQTGGTLMLPASMVAVADTSATGNTLRFVIGVDSNQDGTLEGGEAVVEEWAVRDGGYTDESAASRLVQFTFNGAPLHLWGYIVIAAVDQDGSMVQHGYQLASATTTQTISGTVRDSAGNPIAAAMVGTQPIDRAADPNNFEYMAFTSPSGAFSMMVAPGEYLVTATPNTPEYVITVPAVYRVALASGQSRTDLKFVLDRSVEGPYTIEGDLTGPGGEPVVYYPVHASLGGGTRDAVTDIEGHYLLRVSAGTWAVSPLAGSVVGYYYTGSQQMVTVPASKTGVDFSLLVASNICTGRVTDESAAAVVSLRVGAQTTTPQYEAEAPLNAQGKYLLYLPLGSYRIRPRGLWGYGFDDTGTAIRSFPPNGTADFTVHTNSITISGLVTRTDTSAGVAFARIMGSPTSPNWDGHFETHAHSSGNYTVHCPPGQYQFAANSLLLGSLQSQAVDATANRTGVNFALAPQNSGPVLSNGNVTPQAGTAGTTFTFNVTYTQAQNYPPMQVYAFVDGVPRLMQPVTPSDTNYMDGAAFRCTVQLGAGSHDYKFGAIEMVMSEPGPIVSLPPSGSYSGPTVTATGDPQVSITSPVNGATVKGTVAVIATASDPSGIQKVEFYDGATLKATDTSSPYQWSWDTVPLSVPDGWHTISAKAYSNAGHNAQVSILANVRNNTFDDVLKTSLYWACVEALVREGITSGCSGAPPLYCPTAPVAREQMAKFLCLAAHKTPLIREVPTFADVQDKTHWAYGYIERLADAASWGGTPPTSGCACPPGYPPGARCYCPKDNCTREQMAKFLCIATGHAAMPSCSGVFADVAPGSACPLIERLADPGSWGGTPVTSGCACPSGYPPGARCYCPKENCTRAQMAKFLVLAFGIAL